MMVYANVRCRGCLPGDVFFFKKNSHQLTGTQDNPGKGNHCTVAQ